MRNRATAGRVLLVLSLLLALTSCARRAIHLDAFVGDGMYRPMETIGRLYEEKNPGIKIDYYFAGSGTLEVTIRTLRKGDLFLPGGRRYIDDLASDDLILHSLPVVHHTPAVIVPGENARVESWDDLSRDGIRIAIPNPLLATSGRMAEELIDREETTLSQKIAANVTMLTSDVRETVSAVTDGEVDAAISWRSAVTLLDSVRLAALDVPAELYSPFEIWVAVPTYTTNAREARAFAEFIAGEGGRQVFESFGFSSIGE